MKLLILQDDVLHTISNEMPFVNVLETKYLSFTVISTQNLDNPCIFIGDLKVELYFKERSESRFYYESRSSNFLINNVGVGVIEYCDDLESELIQLGTINVLSSKITTERLKDMLEFICKSDKKYLHCCFSKTFFRASGSNFEYIDLSHKLLNTEATLNFLWGNRHKFISQPCKRVKTIEIIKKLSSKDLVDDRTYSWVLSNMGELELSSNSDDVLLKNSGRSFSSRNISTVAVVDDKDIFENEVILSFLFSVKKLIEKIEDEKNYYSSKSIETSGHYDIVPFIQNFISEKTGQRNKLVNRIKQLVDSCIKFVQNNLTSVLVLNLRPRITQYVSRHSHYLTLYKLMNDWWGSDAIDLNNHQNVYDMLFSIKSMDKLYEIFVLFKINQALNELGFTLNKTKFVDYSVYPSLSCESEIVKLPFDVYNFFQFEDSLRVVNLYVEPVIFPHRASLNDGELFIVDKYSENTDPKKLSKANQVRTPDYIFEIIHKVSSNRKVFVLDAKYSDIDTVLYQRMPTQINRKSGLVDKYFHGIRVYDNGSVKTIDGLFATYISGRRDSRRRITPGIANEYSIWGKRPIGPFIDLVEFSPKSESEHDMSLEFVNKILNVH